MVLVGHSQRLAEPLTSRQRRSMAVVGVLFVLAAVAVGILASVDTGGIPVSRDGCVSVLVAGSTGAEVLHECGAAARSLCHSEYARHDRLAQRLQPQCRLAGILPGDRAEGRGLGGVRKTPD